MKVSVKLFAGLAASSGGNGDRALDLADGATVADALAALDLARAKTRAVFLNAKHAQPTDPLADGDRLDVFPAIGGG